MRGQLGTPLSVGQSGQGTRIYYPVTGGEIVGDRIAATITDGGEWAILEDGGTVRVDVRMQAQSADGAAFYIQYLGIIKMNSAVQAALAGGAETAFDDQYFYTNPRVETGDARYRWLTETFFIGEGRFLKNQMVEYRLWRPI
ncbi:MAG: DUF3237 domain-containing protein [Pseudomonadota bacterium]